MSKQGHWLTNVRAGKAEQVGVDPASTSRPFGSPVSSNHCLNIESQSSVPAKPINNAGPRLEKNSSIHFTFEFPSYMYFRR